MLHVENRFSLNFRSCDSGYFEKIFNSGRSRNVSMCFGTKSDSAFCWKLLAYHHLFHYLVFATGSASDFLRLIASQHNLKLMYHKASDAGAEKKLGTIIALPWCCCSDLKKTHFASSADCRKERKNNWILYFPIFFCAIYTFSHISHSHSRSVYFIDEIGAKLFRLHNER